MQPRQSESTRPEPRAPLPSGRSAFRSVAGTLIGASAVIALATLLQRHGSFSGTGWIVWGAGALLLLLLARMIARHPSSRLDTRAVVMMSVGAALYGVLSAATNWLMVPTISPISLRPAIVMPALFGSLFGPVVGFFTGAVGNVLGDAISGYGVSPQWDLGNGLIGLLAGMALVLRDRPRLTNALLSAAAAVSAGGAIYLGIQHRLTFKSPYTGQLLNHHAWWWLPAAAALLILGARIAFRGKKELLAVVTWGVVGVIGGIGGAALSDIWINGFAPVVVLVGEFLPAAGPDLLLVIFLLPLLYTAYQGAAARSGR